MSALVSCVSKSFIDLQKVSNRIFSLSVVVRPGPTALFTDRAGRSHRSVRKDRTNRSDRSFNKIWHQKMIILIYVSEFKKLNNKIIFICMKTYIYSNKQWDFGGFQKLIWNFLQFKKYFNDQTNRSNRSGRTTGLNRSIRTGPTGPGPKRTRTDRIWNLKNQVRDRSAYMSACKFL